jgi:hypothetical protein
MSKQDVYQVSCLVGRTEISGEVHYRVRWAGFSAHQDTWEPLSHLSNVLALVAEYDQCVPLPASSPNLENAQSKPPTKRLAARKTVHNPPRKARKLIH